MGITFSTPFSEMKCSGSSGRSLPITPTSTRFDAARNVRPVAEFLYPLYHRADFVGVGSHTHDYYHLYPILSLTISWTCLMRWGDFTGTYRAQRFRSFQ